MSENIVTSSRPEGGFAAISKYNPHLWSAEQLRAIFVARKNELADQLHTLRTTPPDTVGQHVLLVGARGMGKSTLMRRLALAVEDDPDLSAAWLPLRFPEEQYTVATLGQFWANVLDSLADALQHLGHSVSELDAAAERIAALPAAAQPDAYLAAINLSADNIGQRLLLLMDNTDLLLHNIGREAQWALRATLQSNPRLFWVGGSYQSLEVDSNYHDAFLDFFRVIELRPLLVDEMRQALLALAETFGGEAARQEMERQLAAQPERLLTLRQLSGGNPRTTVMLYEILANGQKGSVRSDLEALLDNMTPLYKARMDSLADLPRKLFAHILEHWAPVSIGELAAVSQVLNTSISPQLKRLELDGLIEKSTLHGTTRSGYQAAERFFNIWYLMRFSSRRQRSRLTWLVEFMRLWFSSDELSTIAQQRTRDGRAAFRTTHDREYDRALADALPSQAPERHALRWSLLKQLKANRSQLAELFDLEDADADFKGADDYLCRLAALPAQLRQSPHAETEEEKIRWVEAVLGSISLSLAGKEDVADVAADLSRTQFDELKNALCKESSSFEKRFGTAALQAVCSAILNQDFFPDMPDSHLTYEQIRTCFNDNRDALRLVCEQFYNKHEDEWCYKAQKLAQAVWPQDAEIAFRCAWLLQEKLGRYEEAETAYRQAIALDEKGAYAWYSLGHLLAEKLGRYEEAEAAYRQAIALDEKYAYLWNNLGNLLADHLGRYEEAEAAYRKAIALDEKSAYPWNGLGNLLANQLGRYEEAEAAYRQAIDLDEKSAYPRYGLGVLLANQLGRYEEAEAAYRQAIALDEKEPTAWSGLGNLLAQYLARPEEAEAAFRQAIALNENYMASWNSLGDLLAAHFGRYEEAEAAFRKAITLEDNNVAYPLQNLARLLARLGRKIEAESFYRDVVDKATIDNQQLLLQAHLFLGNRQLAMDALKVLVTAAQGGNQRAFFRIKEQVWECHELGLGERLADWMAESEAAGFLAPFIQALYTLAGTEGKLRDLPQESQQMADEIVRLGRLRQKKK
jgi:tetratricopeptide (TPR) repeat protein/energy-coupling factor transporter ATP-binding protein EcfA2